MNDIQESTKVKARKKSSAKKQSLESTHKINESTKNYLIEVLKS